MVTLVLDLNGILALLAILAGIYFLIDIHYFVTNFVIVYVWGPLIRSEKRPDEVTDYYGICTTNDLDIYFEHMNNARYARELDFARLHFCVSTGLYDAITKLKGTVLQSVSHFRYMKPISFLTFYRIKTKMVHWDEKSIYFEHEFVTLYDEGTTTTILSKQGLVGVNGYGVINGLLGEDKEFRPEMPPYLGEWLKLCDSFKSLMCSSR